jgi:NADH-quinone oxidoreductase subunit L
MDDIKKVLAYSTIGQLGYMMLGLGVGGVAGGVAAGFVFGLFHLTTHGFFKAGLFLGSGSVIHAMHHEQSMSQYGGLARKMPITFVTFLLFTLALCGFPYLSSGFFTKDGIIGAAIEFGMIHGRHRILGWMALGAATLTSFYMFRLMFLTFAGRPRNEKLHHHAHESPWAMVLPLILLAVLSLGFVGSNWSFGLIQRESWFGRLVEQPALSDYARESETADTNLPLRIKGDESPENEHRAHLAHRTALVGSVAAFGVGLFIAAIIYYLRWIDPAKIAAAVRPVHSFLVNKWYMDHLYRAAVVLPYLAIYYIIRLFDMYVIDAIVNLWGWLGRVGSWLAGRADAHIVDGAVNGTAWTTGFAGRMLRLTQTGNVRSYQLFIITGVALLILIWAQM